MADNIIIDFQVNTSELTETINVLEKLLQIITEKVDKATNKLTNDTNKLGKETVSSVNKSKQSISSMDSVLKSIGQGIAGAFAVQKIIAFGEASVKAFQEAERNALLLKSAVSVNGGLQSDFEDLIAQSAELQKVTIFSDDAIQQAQTAALQFGLTKDQVKSLIPVVADFASATGQDLQTALDGVIQGINGVGRGLKIYGVTIDENGNRQSRLAEITDQLTKKFDGQAKAVGETAFGAAAKYANQLDDLQEQIGEKLAPKLEALKSFFLTLADTALDVADDIGNFIDALVKINPIISLLKGEDPLENIKSVFVNAEKDVKELTNTAIAENRKLVDEFKKGFQNLSTKDIVSQFETLQDLSKENNEKAKESTGVQKKLYQDLAKEQALQVIALSEIISLRAKGIDTTDEETQALNKLLNVSKLSDKELKELQKTLNKFYDVKALDAKDIIDKEIEKRAKESAKKKADVEDKAAKERIDVLKEQIRKNEEEAKNGMEINLSNLEIAKQKELAIEEHSAAEKLLIDKKYLEEKLKYYEDDPVMQAKIGAEIAEVNTKINEQAIEDKKATDEAITKQNDEKNKAILASDEAAAQRRKEQEKEVYEAIVDAAQQTISIISQAFNNYYNAQSQNIQKNKEEVLKSYDEQIEKNEEARDKNKIGDRDYEANKKKLLTEREKAEKRADKELAKLKHDQAVYNKDIALIQAILNTAVAVTNAITTGDPYTAALRAAIVGAIGAAEIAVIASQPIPKYAKGVERVPGVGTDTSDNITALLSPGERVVSAERNRRYFPILSAIHNERFSPNELNEIAKLSPAQLKSFSLPSLKVNQNTNYRTDLSPAIINNSNQVNSQFGLDEYGVRRALDGGTSIKERSADYLAKSIARELNNNRPSLRRSWK